MNEFDKNTTELLNQLLEDAPVSLDLNECLKRNELGDAELFSSIFSSKVAYDHSEKCWYLWRGNFWEADKTAEVLEMITNEVATQYNDMANIESKKGNIEQAERLRKRAHQLRTSRRANSVLVIASSLRDVALKGTEWDTHTMLLPVANGIVDLRTGEFRAGQPSDYVRDCSPIEWKGPDIPCPVWEKTLENIFNADKDLIVFIQRLMGYVLTGETKEQKLPIFWGHGANGKSTILDTIESILGPSFCYKTPTAALTDFRNANGEAAQPFLLALRGKRLAIASETKEGQKLDASLIKQLTGDQRITARGLYKAPETFALTSKIILVTNNCPPIPDGEDYAMWRRVLRIPFSMRFVQEPKRPNELKEDKDLKEKLCSEYSGILAWMVRGCLEWQVQGLNPPKSVIDSTESYRQEEDLLGQYISERLIIRDTCQVGSSELYQDYAEWCAVNGYYALTHNAFARRIKQRFGPPVHATKGNAYPGIGLLAHE